VERLGQRLVALLAHRPLALMNQRAWMHQIRMPHISRTNGAEPSHAADDDSAHATNEPQARQTAATS
jgi:hypothetical protein